MEIFYHIPQKVTMQWDWWYCKKVDIARKFETTIPKPNALALFEFCIAKIKGVNFIYIKRSDLQMQGEEQRERYAGAATLPGTHSFQFINLGDNRAGTKWCSTGTNYTIIHTLKIQQDVYQPDTVTYGGYVVVIYDNNWWTSIVTEINQEEGDVEVKFPHPKGTSAYFYWPQRDDYCLLLTQTF